MSKSLSVSLCRPVRSVKYQRSSCWLCSVTECLTGSKMASGDARGSRSRVDHSGPFAAVSCRRRGTLPSHMST